MYNSGKKKELASYWLWVDVSKDKSQRRLSMGIIMNLMILIKKVSMFCPDKTGWVNSCQHQVSDRQTDRQHKLLCCYCDKKRRWRVGGCNCIIDLVLVLLSLYLEIWDLRLSDRDIDWPWPGSKLDNHWKLKVLSFQNTLWISLQS